MKRVKCKFTYEVVIWMNNGEYENTKEKADLGEVEKEIKNMLDDELLAEDGREERSKITEFYFGMDEQGRKDSIEKATEFSMAVPIMVLRDEFGFGQQRIIKFAAAFKELYESIDEKYLDLQDILKTIKEEIGVEIVSRK